MTPFHTSFYFRYIQCSKVKVHATFDLPSLERFETVWLCDRLSKIESFGKCVLSLLYRDQEAPEERVFAALVEDARGRAALEDAMPLAAANRGGAQLRPGEGGVDFFQNKTKTQRAFLLWNPLYVCAKTHTR